MENRVSQFAGAKEAKGNTDKPLVSIITSVLNGSKYLEECLQSVLNQSYPYIEHILVDGASTDGTVEMLASYQAKYPDRIRFISEPDEGTGEAVNKGLRMAKGAILGGLPADDFYQPDAVQKVVEFFRGNTGAYFVYGNYRTINEKGGIMRHGKPQPFTVKDLINKGSYFAYCSAFYKREVVEKVGYFEPVLGCDREYWIRVGMVFPMHPIDEVLSNFRVHAGATSSGTSIKTRRKHMRVNYLVTRRYGGSVFSASCRNYYKFLIIEWLRPMLGFAYPWIKKIGVK